VKSEGIQCQIAILYLWLGIFQKPSITRALFTFELPQTNAKMDYNTLIKLLSSRSIYVPDDSIAAELLNSCLITPHSLNGKPFHLLHEREQIQQVLLTFSTLLSERIEQDRATHEHMLLNPDLLVPEHLRVDYGSTYTELLYLLQQIKAI